MTYLVEVPVEGGSLFVQAGEEQLPGGLKSISPDAFGIVLGAECGVVVAKRASEAHLTVTLSWRGGGESADGDD